MKSVLSVVPRKGHTGNQENIARSKQKDCTLQTKRLHTANERKLHTANKTKYALQTTNQNVVKKSQKGVCACQRYLIAGSYMVYRP